jgi:hypothetical protein
MMMHIIFLRKKNIKFIKIKFNKFNINVDFNCFYLFISYLFEEKLYNKQFEYLNQKAISIEVCFIYLKSDKKVVKIIEK